MGHPVDCREAIEKLTQQLDTTYRKVADNFDANDAVCVDDTGDRPTLMITNLEKVEEPASLTALKEQVGNLLPKVDLTEMVLEINALTGFTAEFTHVSEANARANDLPVSICAVLLAEACNIGMEPLIRANARLVDYQSTLPLANLWGGGDVASADGMRLVTPSNRSTLDRIQSTFQKVAAGSLGTTLCRINFPNFTVS